ncbi:MAG: prepilin-type N-terminal cleavage/methylation domain-containing protein [Candidatus Acidiferrales bacterium]|jgi:prepilin-type N-terminal cleavage/methylation domain-containing protein
MTARSKGFSLLELLSVVSIISIIAAIAIPNLLRSRMAANEASAVGSIRAINAAAIEYYVTYGNGFPPSLVAIGTTTGSAVSCTNAQLIDAVLTTGVKDGYTFALQNGLIQLTSAASSCAGVYGYSDGYAIEATPVTVGMAGQRAFCLDATGIIRFNSRGTVSPSGGLCLTTDSPLEEGSSTSPGTLRQ